MQRTAYEISNNNTIEPCNNKTKVGTQDKKKCMKKEQKGLFGRGMWDNYSEDSCELSEK